MSDSIFRVIEPGIHSSVQDGGRRGYRRYGMPLSGPLDPYAYAILNSILGNRENSAAVEVTGSWFSGEFLRDCSFALCGADPGATLDDAAIPVNEVICAKNSSILKFHGMKSGIRTYIGVAGGIEGNVFLGSTSMPRGKRLASGDILCFAGPVGNPDIVEHDFSYIRADGKYKVKVREGPDSVLLGKKITKEFIKDSFKVSLHLDRMGIRLEPKEYLSGLSDGIVTKPVFPGCIQVTGSGMPVIIMNDGQTSGGYPVIAVIQNEDLRIIGQLKTGDLLSFKGV
ncbi:MAG TPA: biotin-dependent carboxyltransferase family protein [Clostridia bacterium]|nr:biotin-dependent carboxyltransferase family protein [Clostridia bacterium]HPQ45737.1 biotin-dependent carboxyltransferase family protein [Clostridia bacterium]